jgi:hypothetical protein
LHTKDTDTKSKGEEKTIIQNSENTENIENTEQSDKQINEISNVNITASSYMSPSSGLTYSPNNVNDDNLQTWWSPSYPNSNGKNSWLKLDFGSEKEVAGIKILNGSHYPNFPNFGDIYTLNNRLTNATLEFSDGSTTAIELVNIDEIQEIKFTNHTTRYIILRPTKWIDGSKWKDLCISYFKALENEKK